MSTSATQSLQAAHTAHVHLVKLVAAIALTVTGVCALFTAGTSIAGGDVEPLLSIGAVLISVFAAALIVVGAIAIRSKSKLRR